ncbi:hypothetical protein [Flavobacterium sp. GP15]|uniref:hypothetical protein n=1 Tax=Flavobacterium sp. GP15 TaxID=2758567 RepID=UPI00165E1840|nr:hypothetical protein [Flavobacterium sp. GP15]
MKFILIRDVPQSECKWLKRDYLKGEVLYLYEGATYNCITTRGLPFSEEFDVTPFFELPRNAVASLGE